MKDNKTACLEPLAKHKKLYAQEIVDITGMPSGSVYSVLNELERMGLVETWQEKREVPAIGLLRYAKITPNGRLFLKGKLMTEKATAKAVK